LPARHAITDSLVVPYLIIIGRVSSPTSLQFDGWTVDPVSGDLVRDGNASRLAQQPLRILVTLYESAGAVVTRERLIKALWPGGIVDFDNGLNVAVRKLRVALDDVGDTPKYIETLPRIGYRFIGSLDAPRAPLIRPSPELRPRLALALGAMGLAIAGGWWWAQTSNDAKPSAAAAHVPSVRAQEYFLDGQHQRSRRDIGIPDALALAQEKFKAALQEDPLYAPAWAALAASISLAVHSHALPPAEGLPKARAAALRAVALDEDLADGHVALGAIYLRHDRDYAAAKAAIDRALRLDDRSPRAWQQLALWYADMGHADEALAALRRVRELDPAALPWSSNYARVLYGARRYDEAIEFLTPLVAANPKLDPAHSILAWALIATGDLAGAEEQLRLVTAPTVNSSDMGFLYAKLGRRDDALRELDWLETRRRAGYGVAYDETIIYAALGELDRGCETLARAAGEHSVLLGWMRLDPRLDPLRGRQCFADVEKRVYPNVNQEFPEVG
jgi:DNA-binding winged helix-turn-helix (wHTH) protein/tetratricopeptide (TPR) repeat protein